MLDGGCWIADGGEAKLLLTTKYTKYTKDVGGRDVFVAGFLLGKGKMKASFTALRGLLVGSSWDSMGVNLKKVEQILLSSDRWSGE